MDMVCTPMHNRSVSRLWLVCVFWRLICIVFKVRMLIKTLLFLLHVNRP